jgi:hypothetical protein
MVDNAAQIAAMAAGAFARCACSRMSGALSLAVSPLAKRSGMT